ncbi:flagellar biosynthesis protein FlhB [bacterium]|nr:flagellar biosynthesis protein FlhB [bacterium]
MAEKPSQDRTELATPRKRKDARKRGQVARSQELSSFLVLFVGLLVLMMMHPMIWANLRGMLSASFRFQGAGNLNYESFVPMAELWTRQSMSMVLPIWGILLAVGVFSAASQVGLSMNAELLAFKPDRINPLNGFKRIFSKRTAFELVKSLLKMGLLLLITWLTLKGESDKLLGMAGLDLLSALKLLGAVAFKLAGRLIMLMVVLALADFAFQRWQYEHDLMMTKQEVRDELKDTEGDPLVKSRLRALQREISVSRMMEDVKKADVVLTNPTTYAVALAYDDSMAAPIVLAKGQRKMAQRIKDVAREAGISVVENKPLARALFAEAEVGESIPLKFFQAVAELLAYVFQMTGNESVRSEA